MKKENSTRKNNQKIAKAKLMGYAKSSNLDIVKELKTNIKSGLDTHYVESWQDKNGYNKVDSGKNYDILVNIFESFFNPFNIVLILLGVISFITNDIMTTITILFLVLISSSIRFIQENKSNKASKKLKSIIKTTATVLRDGKKKEVDISNLVVGDIILLSAGDIIPADLRILESKELFISQSSLTGETEPIEKFSKLSDKTQETKVQPIDMENLCFMGTNVVSGTATAVVISIGLDTYFGSMTKLITKRKTKTNFDKGINKTSVFLINSTILMVFIVFIINGFTKHNWLSSFLFAISMAVGLIPEMLPVIVSANLAKGAVSMSKKRTIVKNINSIQNFGAMDVLCCDKTGTITENIVVLQYHVNMLGEEDLNVLKYAYLNSNFQTGLKNLLDLAIIDKALENNFYSLNFEYKKVDEIPFDFSRRRMSVVLEDKHGKTSMITKGAVEEMLQICSSVEYNNRVVKLTKKIKKEVLDKAIKMNSKGMRVLAIARKEEIKKNTIINSSTENEMTLMGFLSFFDPPKQSSKSAIELLKNNNVKIKVLTGDNDIITKQVCKNVGIKNDKVLLGTDLEEMNDIQLKKEIESTDIFAKLSPQQKLIIIKNLKADGHVVGFIGDGINDAPAMREADVAISVDSAVDIAKESADIILLKKDLNVLSDAVLEGRKIFCNILKYIKITISSNFGNILSILFASVFLPFLPMLPVQILVLNILYDVSQISIPWDNVDEEYLTTQKKWNTGSIKNFIIYFGFISSLCDILLFLVMYKILGWNIALFNSGWFLASTITQSVAILFLRTAKKPFKESTASLELLISLILINLVVLFLIYSSVGKYIKFIVIPSVFYFYLLPVIITYIVLIETMKKFYVKRFKELI